MRASFKTAELVESCVREAAESEAAARAASKRGVRWADGGNELPRRTIMIFYIINIIKLVLLLSYCS